MTTVASLRALLKELPDNMEVIIEGYQNDIAMQIVSVRTDKSCGPSKSDDGTLTYLTAETQPWILESANEDVLVIKGGF